MSDEIKTKISEMINKYPRHYVSIIKKDIELNEWVLSNSYDSDNYAERIYVSINGVPSAKECGNYPKFNTIFKGFFEYCGPKSICQCSRTAHSNTIKDIHSSKSDLEKEQQSKKRISTLKDRYGVENPMFYDEFREKLKQTNLERYGVENPLQSKEIQEKTQKTKKEKYGVSFSLQSKEIQERTQKTKKEKYGDDYMKTVREELYKKYNGNPFQSTEIREKINKKMNQKYGVSSPLQFEEFKEKAKITNIERYGVDNPAKFHISQESLDILNDKELFCEFVKDKTVYEITNDLGVESTLIYRLLKKYDAYDFYKKKSSSYLETEMKEFLDSNNITYEQNNRTILGGKELDFYIPDYNMAIEMNGIYYHSDKFRPDPKYHYNKWKICKNKGIHLISVFEDDWNLQQDKVCNMILNFFNKKPKGIPARKTHIQKITGKIAKSFLDQYHLQNFVTGTHYGAFDVDDNLIGVMTFGTTRNGRFELKRFVTDNYTHPGLFSKLFKYAQSDLKFTEVVSFSDNTCFTGNVYKMNGFDFIGVIKPDYRYFFDGKRSHKSNFKKANIKQKFPELSESIDNGMTESAAMELLGIQKIYDCGKCEWIWKNV
jgi:hypothetical protein